MQHLFARSSRGLEPAAVKTFALSTRCTMTARWTLALLAATHAFQPHAPVQRLRPLRVEVFDEAATLLIEQARGMERDEHPLAEPCVCETAEPIVTSTIFWSVVNDACQVPERSYRRFEKMIFRSTSGPTWCLPWV